MSDLLYEPRPMPPPLERLERSPALARFQTLLAVWRAGRNLLELFHPGVMDRPYWTADMGAFRLITVNDPALARQVLSERADRYVKSHLYQALLADLLGPDASLIADGEMARYKRRLIAPAFNARSMKRLEGVVERHVEAALARWRALGPGAEIDLSRETPMLAMEVAMEAFFSASLGDRGPRLAALLDDAMMIAGSPSMADVMDLPRWVPRRSRKALQPILAEIDRVLYAVIDARLADREGPAPDAPDMLDGLVRALDPETGRRLTREEIRSEVITLFLAGHETTALSLSWGLDRLAREPEAQDALAGSVAAAVAAKGGPLSAAEARATPLVAETYDEMLRLYPPGFVVARTAAEPDSFGELEIRRGDRVQVAVFMLHRNPRYWARPGAFEPSRFTGPQRSPAFMPFGAGPRNCIGMGLARMESHMLLARLLAETRLEPVGPPPEPLGKITLRSRAHIRVRLQPRVAAQPAALAEAGA